MITRHRQMKTQSRIRLVGAVVFPLALVISLISFSHAREGSTAAAMLPESENTFEFTNNESEDARDLHIKWSRAVNVKSSDPFKKVDGSGNSTTNFSNGTVGNGGGKAIIKVSWDGTDPEVKEWWWTKADKSRLGQVKTGNPASARAPATSTVRDGLRIVTFDTVPGRITVNLPDDMRAGDTISGTVVAEPKGQTPEERTKNLLELNGYVIDVEPPRKADGTSSPIVKVQITATLSPFTFTLPPSSTLGPTDTIVRRSNTAGLGISLTGTTGSSSGTTIVPIEIVSLSLTSVAPLKVPQLPSIGQQGRPVEIYGPFDGNTGNTRLMYGPAGSSVQDFEKNTDNVTGGFGLLQPLAESPRKCVFRAPTNVTSPVEITLKEGDKTVKGTYRNVGVNLTAPKTNLLKGEHTELHVEVNGLQGLNQPVPLTLDSTDSTAVITKEGGPYEMLMIQPSQVGADGRYTTTRGITGIQAGGWNATATVVTHKFDFCLQDDSNPGNVVFVNARTGDYLFTPSGGTSLSGQGTVTRNGCTITLTDSPPDRRVQSTIDPCTHTGSASVQTSPPNSQKIKFTITDRNMTNNTCSCGPGCR